MNKRAMSKINWNDINVFESLRIYNGKIFRFEEHLKRLCESAKSCGVLIPSNSEIKQKVFQKIKTEKIHDGFLRLDFRAGKMQVLLREKKISANIFGINLKTASFRMPSPKESIVQAKSGNYRLQLLETVSGGLNEMLFLDENHFITEARVGNFFMVKKGMIFTPPAHSALNGITREVVIECARELGVLVKETLLTRHEAFNADEAFLTNTSWEILPVRSLDGRLVQESVPGSMTQKLIKCFHRKVQLACQPQKKIPQIKKLSAPSSQSRIKKV